MNEKVISYILFFVSFYMLVFIGLSFFKERLRLTSVYHGHPRFAAFQKYMVNKILTPRGTRFFLFILLLLALGARLEVSHETNTYSFLIIMMFFPLGLCIFLGGVLTVGTFFKDLEEKRRN